MCHAPRNQNILQEAPSEIHAEHGLIKAHGMQAIVGDVHVEATALPKRVATDAVFTATTGSSFIMTSSHEPSEGWS